MAKRILVLGGTGLLGEPAARQLQAAGFQVRLLARSPQKARSLFDASFEIVAGDATSGEDVERALRGCQGAHLSVSGAAEPAAAQHVARLAQAAGLQRVGYISGCTVCKENRWFPMVEMKWQAEAAVRGSGVDYTIFAPTWPLEMLARYARNGKPFVIGRQTNPFHFYARDDLGRMVAQAYQSEAAANQRFVVHGPEAIPFREALWRYCQRVHPEAEKIASMPVWLAKLMATATRNEMMKMGADLAGYFDKVGELGDPRPANALLGPPLVTLDDWLTARAIPG